jgi:hypothetical protein
MGDDNNAFITAIYNQAMEEIRDRCKVEWQTFAVVNVIYGAALKGLYD